MLPLTSNSSATLMPASSGRKSAIGCGRPASSTSKSRAVRSSTNRPFRSRTTALMRTRSTPALNVAAGGGWAGLHPARRRAPPATTSPPRSLHRRHRHALTRFKAIARLTLCYVSINELADIQAVPEPRRDRTETCRNYTGRPIAGPRACKSYMTARAGASAAACTRGKIASWRTPTRRFPSPAASTASPTPSATSSPKRRRSRRRERGCGT